MGKITRSILVVWPPSFPAYWSLCHHFTLLGELAGFLAKDRGIQVDILDAGVEIIPWANIARVMLRGYDLVILINQPENLFGLIRLVNLAKQMEIPSKFLTFGPVSAFIPRLFQQYPLDAIVRDGDWEIVIRDYLNFLSGEKDLSELRGLFIKTSDGWIDMGPGPLCNNWEWGFPLLDELPLETFHRLIGQRELSFTVARGCPLNCTFCHVPVMQGMQDRRRPISLTMDFLYKYASKFDYVSFYAPTFTANRAWVEELCKELQRLPAPIRWKCVTTIAHTDEDLVAQMACAGCFRIGFGIESFERDVQRYLGKIVNEERVRRLILSCKAYGISPLCFVMIGIPGQTKEGILYTIETLEKWGARVRLTAYAPLGDIAGDENITTIEDVERLNRLTCNWGNVREMSNRELAGLLFSRASNY